MSEQPSQTDPQSDPLGVFRKLCERMPHASNEPKWQRVVDALIGAVFGAAFAYAAGVYQVERATEARRDVLLMTLIQELESVPQQVSPPFDANRTFYRDPIRLSSIPVVLGSDIFEYPKDTKVVRGVLNLQITINIYNDMVQTTNQAQLLTNTPEAARRQMYDDMAIRHASVRKAKDSLLEALSPQPYALDLLTPRPQ